MANEEEISLDDLEKPPVKQIEEFFAGEAAPEFIEQAELEKLVAFYASCKQSAKQIEETVEKTGRRIKELLRADSMQDKKFTQQAGGHTVILTKRDGSVKVDYEKYIEDVCGEKELKQLMDSKDMVKRGQGTSPYITVGKGSVSLEVV